jgi:hypothetical protein
LDYLKEPHPVDAEPLATAPFGLIPYKFAPVRFSLPSPGPEPINVATPNTAAPGHVPPENPPAVIRFSDRWSTEKAVASTDWLERVQDPQPAEANSASSALAFSDDGWVASAVKSPFWPTEKNAGAN